MTPVELAQKLKSIASSPTGLAKRGSVTENHQVLILFSLQRQVRWGSAPQCCL